MGKHFVVLSEALVNFEFQSCDPQGIKEEREGVRPTLSGSSPGVN
jgi:hypothetical protein